MRIIKLNEWKCDIDINDVYTKPEGVLGNMIEHFKLIYNPRTGCYDCDGDVDLYDYYDRIGAAERKAFDKAFVRNGKMTIKFGTVKGKFLLPGDNDKPYILTSLEGCPKTVEGDFNCSCNQLTSLKGCPEKVGGDFSCGYNQLTSLKGCPKTVDCDFYCSHNQLTSLEGCPEKVCGSFFCNGNNVVFTEEYVRSVCDVKNDICA